MMHPLLILMFAIMVVTSMGRSTQFYYTSSTAPSSPVDAGQTSYPTDTSTVSYPLRSTTGTYTTPRPMSRSILTFSSHWPAPTYPWYSTSAPTFSTSRYPFERTTYKFSTRWPTPTYPWYSTSTPTFSTSRYPFGPTNTAPTFSKHWPAPTYPWYSTSAPTFSTSRYPFERTTYKFSTRWPTPTYPWYSTSAPTFSTPQYPFESSTTNYQTASSTSWYPHHSSYPTYVMTDDYTTRDFSSTSPPSPYSTWTWSSPTILVEPFTKLIIPVARNVVLRSISPSMGYSVEFTCSMNMNHHVSPNVTGMTLLITSTDDCDVIVYANELETIHIGYVFSFKMSGNLKGNQLAIRTDGVSKIVLNSIYYNAVEVLLSNNSSVTLSGVVQRLSVLQLGRGTFDAHLLSIDYATVFTKNSGLVKIKSNKHLSLTVDGPGFVIWCSPDATIDKNSATNPTPPEIIYYCD